MKRFVFVLLAVMFVTAVPASAHIPDPGVLDVGGGPAYYVGQRIKIRHQDATAPSGTYDIWVGAEECSDPFFILVGVEPWPEFVKTPPLPAGCPDIGPFGGGEALWLRIRHDGGDWSGEYQFGSIYP